MYQNSQQKSETDFCNRTLCIHLVTSNGMTDDVIKFLQVLVSLGKYCVGVNNRTENTHSTIIIPN